MSTARLSADLLAPKGHALPLDDTYDHPMQVPGNFGRKQVDTIRRPPPEPIVDRPMPAEGPVIEHHRIEEPVIEHRPIDQPPASPLSPPFRGNRHSDCKILVFKRFNIC